MGWLNKYPDGGTVKPPKKPLIVDTKPINFVQQDNLRQLPMFDQKKITSIKEANKKDTRTYVGPSKEKSLYQQKIDLNKKQQFADSNPNAKLINNQLETINPDRTLTGAALSPNAKRLDKGLEHIMGGLEAATYLTGVGELYGAAKPFIKSGVESVGRFVGNRVEDVKRGLYSLNSNYLKKQAQEVVEGNKWSQEWFSHPLSKQRYENFVEKGNPYLKPEEALFRSNAYNDFSNKIGTINLDKSIATKYNATVARDNLEKLTTEGYFTKPSTQWLDKHRNTVGVFRHGNNDAYVDILHPHIRNKTFNVANTTVHENTHGITKGNEALTPNAKRAFSNAFEKDVIGNDKYLTKPTEIHARISELRRTFNLKPDQRVSSTMLDDMIEKGLSKKTSVDSRFFELIKDKKQLKWLFNNAPSIVPIVVGTSIATKEYKNGGTINWLNKY